MSHIHRRKFMISGGMLLAVPHARSQQPVKVYRVGLIFTTSPVSEMAGPEPSHPSARAFVQEMRSLGYFEGHDLMLDRRSANGKFEHFGAIVTELVRLKADAIVTVGDEMALEAKRVTTSVPIVATVYGDPVELGLVSSLARPGGNVTGVVVTAGPEIEGKRAELLKVAMPGVRRVAFLGRRTDWENQFGPSIQNAAKKLGLTLVHALHNPNDYKDAFANILNIRPDAVLIANTPTNFANRKLIVDFNANNKLPSMYSRREYVEAGGLLSYGTHVPDLLRRAARLVDRILKGASAGDLPIEQPSKFELLVNLKAAKALGLTIPAAMLLRADQVIE
jgi:putative ABC transport system substrate-binding protein